jgi:hypothetical protein
VIQKGLNKKEFFRRFNLLVEECEPKLGKKIEGVDLKGHITTFNSPPMSPEIRRKGKKEFKHLTIVKQMF